MLVAQSPDTGDEPVLDPGIELYAKQYALPYEEAQRRLYLQAEMVALAGKIQDSEPSYAGSWIVHEPDFYMVVSLATADAEKIVHSYLEGVPWADAVKSQEAQYTIAQLDELRVRMENLLAELELGDNSPLASGLDVKEGKVNIYLPDPDAMSNRLAHEAKFEATGLSLDDFSFIHQAKPMIPAAYTYPYVIGGQSVIAPPPGDEIRCTSGFVWRRVSDNRRFVSTAGHCEIRQGFQYGGDYEETIFMGPNLLRYNPETQPFVRSDIQITNPWVRDVALTNLTRINSTSMLRVVSSTGRDAVMDQWVCKYGRSTGATCGWVVNIHYRPRDYWASTYVLVTNLYILGDIACAGDSGGPVFMSASGGVSALGTLSTAAETETPCNRQGKSFSYTPVDEIQELGYVPLTNHYPQYYYQNVFWSETDCKEYSSQLDENGNITSQEVRTCSTYAPGSGTIQSYTAFVVANALHEAIWRGNAGYIRDVPLAAEGRVNWGAAPAWTQCCSGTPPRAQGDYIVGNNWYQNVYWTDDPNDCIEYKAPLTENGVRDMTQRTMQRCRTTAPGSGTIQTYTAYVTGGKLHEAMWRNNYGYIRDVPLNSLKTDVDWDPSPTWTQCCTNSAPPRAQDAYTLNHP